MPHFSNQEIPWLVKDKVITRTYTLCHREPWASFVKMTRAPLDTVSFQTWQFYLMLHQTSTEQESLSRPSQGKSNKGNKSISPGNRLVSSWKLETDEGKDAHWFLPEEWAFPQQIIDYQGCVHPKHTTLMVEELKGYALLVWDNCVG